MMAAAPAAALAAPSPAGGLGPACFRPLARGGFGDPLNAYAHSMEWFDGHLYVGTTRSNLCMMKVSRIHGTFDAWPVECPDYLYDQDMHAQIWRLPADALARAGDEDPAPGWASVYRAPDIVNAKGEALPRELGYRCMAVFQGRSDPKPALYVATYAPARGFGTHILRSLDGRSFETVPRPAGIDDGVITLRLLVAFKGRLFTAPTGRAGGAPNLAGQALVYATEDPVNGSWDVANEPAFGDAGNLGVFEMAACGDWLYAGTGNLKGYQVWRTRAEGRPPFAWERVLVNGAHRGPTNQGVASLCAHRGHLYVGSGIQHGGIDPGNKVGPAGPELVRIHEDGTWDLIVGFSRDTPEGYKPALSGLLPGFGNFFAGYFWRMVSHDGWLYLGTFDWSLMLRFATQGRWPRRFHAAITKVGLDAVFAQQAGADLHRSADGENWLTVTRDGFGNPYNYGIRTLVSTPGGLSVGTVNPFAPKVAERLEGGGWAYRANPDGGAEIWLGRRP